MQSADPGRTSRDRKPRAGREVGPSAHRDRDLILGAIIAGGRASRFGSDKGAALLGGTALIDHAARAIRDHVDSIVIVGRDWREFERVEDLPTRDLGPLGGMAGALCHANAGGYDAVLTIGCDMPRVPADLIEALLRRVPSVCVDAPVLGTWPADLGVELVAHLESGRERSVRGWARSIGAHPIAASMPLANVNRPEDLAAL